MAGGRGAPDRKLCVNCNICVNMQRRYQALTLKTNVTAVICRWVQPRIVTEEDYVCVRCKHLATVTANIKQEVGSDGDADTRLKGHSHACLTCGCSILRKPSNKLIRDDANDMQLAVLDIVRSRVAPHEITVSDRVCKPCWLRVGREVVRMKTQQHKSQLDTSNALDSTDQSVDIQEPTAPITTDLPKPAEKKVTKITLANYRRSANRKNKCVFPNCTNKKYRNISDKLRATILHDHKYYIAKLARVCEDHLTSDQWHTLYDSKNSIDHFSEQQIEHVFSFVNAYNQTIDFEDLASMDDNVFEYWLGMSKEAFNNVFNDLPRLSELRRGGLGLAALLLKMRTGDSNEKLASLMGIPRRTLEGKMDEVRKILGQEF